MRIRETLHKDSMSSSAITQVPEGESAGIGEMVFMVDGVIGWDHPADVRLVSTESPEMKSVGEGQNLITTSKVFDPASMEQEWRLARLLPLP